LSGDRAYTEIDEYATPTGNPILKKGYTFSYSYDTGNQRMYLASLQEKGSDNSPLPPYTFSYKNKDQLPTRNSLQQDIWGFYNANNASSSDPIQFPKVFITYDFFNPSKTAYLPFGSASNVDPGIDRSSNASVVDYGSLNKIVYPTKGYTTYTYEINQFDSYQGGGIRIKEIDDFSRTGASLLSKKYFYGGGTLGGAYPQVAYPINPTYGGDSYGLVRFSNNQSILGSSQGSYVGYANVAIQQISSGNTNNGTATYTYSTDKDVDGTLTNIASNCNSLHDGSAALSAKISGNTYFPFFEMQTREDRRGLLLKEEYTDVNDNSIKSTIYHYEPITDFITNLDSYYTVLNPDDQTIATELIKGTRPFNTEKMLLTYKTETMNTGNVGQHSVQPIISKSSSYTYTDGAYNGQFLRSVTNYDDNINFDPAYQDNMHFLQGKSNQTIYKYPFDYASSASNGVMGSMVAMNYINPVISEIKTRTPNAVNNSPVTYYTDAKIHDYKYNPLYYPYPIVTAIVPSQEYFLNAQYPLIQGSSGNSVEVTDPWGPGVYFDRRIEYETYDSYGNPTMIRNDSQHEALTWSWDGLLLAKSISPTIGAITTDWLPQSWQQVYDPAPKVAGPVYQYDGGTETSLYFSPDGVHPTTISFWAKSGTFLIDVGGIGVYTQSGTAPSDWTYYNIVFPANAAYQGYTIELTGTALINGFLMTNDGGVVTKYVYDSFNRLSYTIDPNGKKQSYEYDAYGRLVNVRDQNNNILKHNEYHYALF
jgi:YD repeat-containing protein